MKPVSFGVASLLALAFVSTSSMVHAAPLLGDGPFPPKRLTIGGPGTCGSDGFDDPGRLNDGVTEASAVYIFTLDPGLQTLTLTVDNTSPVLAGVNNPVLTDIYFNCPMQITGMSLVSQTSSAGVDPAFNMTFDADLDSAPNPNGASGFGHFSVGLIDPGGIEGAIANPDADTYVTDPSNLAVSTCTFVFDLVGDLTGLTSRSFTNRFSVVPPGSKVAAGAAKFQAGGEAEASGFITGVAVECFLVISSEPGDEMFTGLPSNHVFPTLLADTSRYYGMNIFAPVTIPIDRLPGPGSRLGNRMNATGIPGGNTTHQNVSHFYVQCFLWNPEQNQTYPEQWSAGVEVTTSADGTVTAVPYGDLNGMIVIVEPVVGSDGRRYLRFPFYVTPG